MTNLLKTAEKPLALDMGSISTNKKNVSNRKNNAILFGKFSVSDVYIINLVLMIS